jgi:toxin YoeB
VRVVFTPIGWEDCLSWQQDKAHLDRVNRLINDMQRDPFVGIGKPERLRNNLAGLWSRRVSEEHRLVYKGEGDDIVVLQVRSHH